MTRERFSFRTIGIPVAAVVVFYIIQIIVVLIYSILYSLIYYLSGQISGADILSTLEDLIMRQTNNIGAIYSVVVAAAAAFALFLLLKGNPRAVRREKTSKGAVLASIIIMVGVSGLISLQMLGLSALGEHVPYIGKILKDYNDLAQAFVGDGNIAMIILSTCILVPVAEELVFRGIIQGELRRVFPAWATILIQAVIFALVHGNVVQISYVIFPALLLGLVYEWTKSIYVPIALHMIFNFIGSALPQMLVQNDAAVLYLYVIQIAFIPAAIIGIFYLKSRRRTDPEGIPDQGPQTLQPEFYFASGRSGDISGPDSSVDSGTAHQDVPFEEEIPGSSDSDSNSQDGSIPASGESPGAEQRPYWIHRDSV
ncbi:MAG: CPBP family intramembrane glutamic endopeptidase [Saccharofermentanales bacterium]